MKKALVIIMITATLLLTLSGCGKSPAEVPDLMIESFILDSEVYEDYSYAGDCTWRASHKPDKETHTDRVSILVQFNGAYGTIETVCNAEFVYNRASDLWSLQRGGQWTEPDVSFNNNLIGYWEFENPDYGSPQQTISLYVKSVEDGIILLEYEVFTNVVDDYYQTIDWYYDDGEIEVTQNGDVWNSFDIELEYPYYCVERHKKIETTTVTMGLSVATGIWTAIAGGPIMKY